MSRALDADFGVGRADGFWLQLALSVPPGRTAALLGPNGAGKSTAVAALTGLLPVERGRIKLGEIVLDEAARDCFVPPEERHIGAVFQDSLLFPHLSVAENVAFGLRSRGIGKDEALTRARGWLDRLGMHGLRERQPAALSGGQAQRVALARALITEPSMLLLDEPLSALDVTARAQLRRTLVEHLADFPGPRLIITHDPTEAFLLADEIHVIEEGEVTQSGSADEIRLRPRTAYAADLAGSNLLVGHASAGEVRVGSHTLHVPGSIAGEVLVTIRPNAILVHRHQPEGSARNVWPTRIELLEHLGERVRIRTGEPLPVTAEITAEATSELGLRTGARIWLSLKATEIGIEPNQGG